METKGDKISPWTVMNRWLYDGSKTSPFPKELIDDKSIGPQYILYYFRDSIYNLVINKLFNNYSMFSLDRVEVLKFLKESVMLSGYKPKFIPRYKDTKSKIGKILKAKHPYLKWQDINLWVELIDKSDDKDQIYETVGLYSPKKLKTKKTKTKKKKKKDDMGDVLKVNKSGSLNKFMKGFVMEKGL